MKQIMNEEVSANQATMFNNATQGIWSQLETMCKQCRNTMRGRVQRMFQTIARDYQAIVSVDAGKDRATGKPERIAQRKVDDVISQSEAVFAEVLDCDLEGLKAAEVTGLHGRMVDAGSEADIEDATQPLIVLSDDGGDEDDGVDF